MRSSLFSLTLLLFGIMLISDGDTSALSFFPKTEATCANPNGKPVDLASTSSRCYGYDPCAACHDCSRCGYCNNGGSCGVCSGSRTSNYRKKSSSYSRQCSGSTRSYNGISAYSSPTTAPSTRTVYLPAPAFVSAKALNVRSGPGTKFEILVQLSAGEPVTITETAGVSWVKIEVPVWNGREIITLEGFVYKKYLSF